MTDYVHLTNEIVRRIVDSPDAVDVVSHPSSRGTTIEIAVADSDIGKLIGKGGRNIEAIRAVVRAAGLRQHERIQVELRHDNERDDHRHDEPAGHDEGDTHADENAGAMEWASAE